MIAFYPTFALYSVLYTTTANTTNVICKLDSDAMTQKYIDRLHCNLNHLVLNNTLYPIPLMTSSDWLTG